MKTVSAICEKFESITGLRMKFEVMNDGIVGIYVSGNDIAPKLAKTFFKMEAGLKEWDFADLKEYKKRYPESLSKCDFGVMNINVF
jgi:hypothetical protein